MKIYCVINGERTPVEVAPDAPVYEMRNAALKLSHNTGRHPDHWDVRNSEGARLDHRMWIGPKGCGLVDGDLVYISLLIGFGGSIAPQRSSAGEEE